MKENSVTLLQQVSRGLRVFRRNKSALIGLILMIFVIFIVIAGPLLTTYDPYATEISNNFKPPSGAHLLGTDVLGRDILSRILQGTRISVFVGAAAVSIAIIIGFPLGTFSGYVGGRLDEIIMRFTDGLLAFPYVLLAVLLVAILGVGLENSIVAVGIASSPFFARIARAGVMSVKQEEYVLAAQAIGEKKFSILLRYIIPNSIQNVIVMAVLRSASAIITVASLSFLGIGATPPTPELGLMVSEGRPFLGTFFHVATFPGIMLTVITLAFNLFGDGVNDLLNPRASRG